MTIVRNSSMPRLLAFAALGISSLVAMSVQAQTYVILHSFGGPTDAGFPKAALIQAADGDFYGTASGGIDGGSLFKMDSTGAVTILHSFTGSDGHFPVAALIQTADGTFYGTNSLGGAGANSRGTIFQMDAADTVTVLHTFRNTAGSTEGDTPDAALIKAADGDFYGTTAQGGGVYGNVFKMDAAANVTDVYSFQGDSGEVDDGADPLAALIQTADGTFYGTTHLGGDAGFGTVFSVTSDGLVTTTLHTFQGQPDDGNGPLAALLLATNGYFYGTTEDGGTNDLGTVFKMDTSGNVTIVHSFDGTDDGAYPQAELIQATDGNLYGTTAGGVVSNLYGTIFKMDVNGNVTVLHSFAGSYPNSDGATPQAALLQAADGNLYGTTFHGGPNDTGTIFKVNLNTIFANGFE